LAEELPEKLKEYLRNRYKEVVEKRGTFDLDVEKNLQFKSGTMLKWRLSGSGVYPMIYEDSEGKVFVWSPTTGEVVDIISLSIEDDKLHDKRRVKYPSYEETIEIWRTMCNRRNWKKVEKRSRNLVEWLRRADRNAKQVTKKTGFKVVFHIPPPGQGDRFHFIASFDSKGMSDEEKMRMIGKAIDVVEEARKGL